jgi:hypothetical protein
MDGRFMAEEPEDIVYTLKLTATLKEWTELREQLSQKWPSSRLNCIITEMVLQARNVMYAKKDDNPRKDGGECR